MGIDFVEEFPTRNTKKARGIVVRTCTWCRVIKAKGSAGASTGPKTTAMDSVEVAAAAASSMGALAVNWRSLLDLVLIHKCMHVWIRWK